MKNLMVLTSILFSLTAFAGPEEHKDLQVCYSSTAASNTLPAEVCIETLDINLEDQKITAYSYFNGALFSDLTISYLARRNEDFYSFRSVSKIKNNLKLFISGQVDNLGQADINYLDIRIADENGNVFVYKK